jgi:Ca-activated chloride channel family protein
MTGGKFFRARDTGDLAGIYAEIDKLEPVQRQGRAVRPKIERYPLPLAAALVLGLLALVRGRRR